MLTFFTRLFKVIIRALTRLLLTIVRLDIKPRIGDKFHVCNFLVAKQWTIIHSIMMIVNGALIHPLG